MQHPDEGTIHAWLDGALPDEEARAVEDHVAACAECGARMAEARGLVAGASRIVGALDDVPAGVVPGGGGRRPRLASRPAWWRRPGVGVAAALAIVAVGTTMVVTRDWHQTVRQTAASAESMTLAGDSAFRADSPASVPAQAEEQRASARAADPEQDSRRAALERADAPPPAPLPALRQVNPEPADRAAERLEASRNEAGLAARAARRVLDDSAASKARTAVAGGTAREAPSTRPRDSVAAAAEMPRLADVAPTTLGQSAVRARQSAAPIVGGHTLMTTATDLAGCYALELREAPDAMGPPLPSVVQLAVSARDAADEIVAPPMQGFTRTQRPLLVPPATDSAQLGWRLAADDSVSVRLASEGRAVLVTFPTVSAEPRVGFATTPELPGSPSWTGPVLVQRVPCPER